MTPVERTAVIESIYQVSDTAIYGFFKEHRFLSNFHECNILYDGMWFGSTEAAYQAAKSLNPAVRYSFQYMKPSKARMQGRAIKLRPDWMEIRKSIMSKLILEKFTKWPDLKDLLLATRDKYLEETNYWNDRFWGADMEHKGENNLGKILMATRHLLK